MLNCLWYVLKLSACQFLRALWLISKSAFNFLICVFCFRSYKLLKIYAVHIYAKLSLMCHSFSACLFLRALWTISKSAFNFLMCCLVQKLLAFEDLNSSHLFWIVFDLFSHSQLVYSEELFELFLNMVLISLCVVWFRSY